MSVSVAGIPKNRLLAEQGVFVLSAFDRPALLRDE